MKTFLHVNDLGPLDLALAEAAEIKADRYKYEHLGHHKTALLIFSTTRSAHVFLPRKPPATWGSTSWCSMLTKAHGNLRQSAVW